MRRNSIVASRIRGFYRRLVVALLIFGMIFGISIFGGAPGQAVRNGVNYLLTKNYDFSGRERSIEKALKWVPDLSRLGIKPKRDLDVEVSTPGKLPDLPVSGRLVRGFGWQRDASNWLYFHEGIELAVTKGTIVRAVLPGKVVRVETDKRIGKVLVIEHDHDCATLYGRLGEAGVKTGQEVVQGQVIGTTEDTLFYFQLRDGDKLVDPTSRLQQ
ncbi:MAG TPA: M23 family metallopeptidase [Syntrophomonadaceae bacterium]|nr:M23 family metallopeptidase [Syntrophomonadaceae bacterium]